MSGDSVKNSNNEYSTLYLMDFQAVDEQSLKALDNLVEFEAGASKNKDDDKTTLDKYKGLIEKESELLKSKRLLCLSKKFTHHSYVFDETGAVVRKKWVILRGENDKGAEAHLVGAQVMTHMHNGINVTQRVNADHFGNVATGVEFTNAATEMTDTFEQLAKQLLEQLSGKPRKDNPDLAALKAEMDKLEQFGKEHPCIPTMVDIIFTPEAAKTARPKAEQLDLIGRYIYRSLFFNKKDPAKYPLPEELKTKMNKIFREIFDHIKPMTMGPGVTEESLDDVGAAAAPAPAPAPVASEAPQAVAITPVAIFNDDLPDNASLDDMLQMLNDNIRDIERMQPESTPKVGTGDDKATLIVQKSPSKKKKLSDQFGNTTILGKEYSADSKGVIALNQDIRLLLIKKDPERFFAMRDVKTLEKTASGNIAFEVNKTTLDYRQLGVSNLDTVVNAAANETNPSRIKAIYITVQPSIEGEEVIDTQDHNKKVIITSRNKSHIYDQNAKTLFPRYQWANGTGKPTDYTGRKGSRNGKSYTYDLLNYSKFGKQRANTIKEYCEGKIASADVKSKIQIREPELAYTPIATVEVVWYENQDFVIDTEKFSTIPSNKTPEVSRFVETTVSDYFKTAYEISSTSDKTEKEIRDETILEAVKVETALKKKFPDSALQKLLAEELCKVLNADLKSETHSHAPGGAILLGVLDKTFLGGGYQSTSRSPEEWVSLSMSHQAGAVSIGSDLTISKGNVDWVRGQRYIEIPYQGNVSNITITPSWSSKPATIVSKTNGVLKVDLGFSTSSKFFKVGGDYPLVVKKGDHEAVITAWGKEGVVRTSDDSVHTNAPIDAQKARDAQAAAEKKAAEEKAAKEKKAADEKIAKEKKAAEEKAAAEKKAAEEKARKEAEEKAKNNTGGRQVRHVDGTVQPSSGNPAGTQGQQQPPAASSNKPAAIPGQ